MTKHNILVFPCGSEIALDIYSSVQYSAYFNLIGASSIEDHGKYVYENYVANVPFVDDEDFIPTMARIVKEYEIDAIFPAVDSAITALKTNEQRIGCMVIAPPARTTEICLSKELTYSELNGVVRIPRIFNPEDVREFPCFAKPKVGHSSIGTKILYSQIEVDGFVKGKRDILVLEYLPGEEYTVDCFTDKDGKLLYAGARIRARIANGISVNTYFAEDQSDFIAIAEKINSTIQFRGAWFYQVKRNKAGELTLLEVASRLGGSSLLSRAIGVNFALLTLFDAFDYKVDILCNEYDVVLDRALGNRYKISLTFDSVYCDYDDCLILDKKTINVQLVSFLYKCINEKKQVVLLSKHEGDLASELKLFRLDKLFDRVINIGKTEQKYKFITSKKSIYIDDSYAERKQVKESLGISVFSPEMIDVLL